MKMRSIAIGLFFVGSLAYGVFQQKWEPTKEWIMTPKMIRRPAKGYVPDEATAVRIGEAVIIGQYGKEWFEHVKPFRAKLFNDVWVVYGAFNAKDPDGTPNLGGPTTVEISKVNGAILGTYVKQ